MSGTLLGGTVPPVVAREADRIAEDLGTLLVSLPAEQAVQVFLVVVAASLRHTKQLDLLAERYLRDR